MKTPPPTNLYTRPRFPAEIISRGVWPSCRFCLSYRDVAELMAERGVILTHEAVQYWAGRSGRPMPISYAAGVQVCRVLATLVQRQQRQRERRLGRFKSPARAQRFLSAYGPVAQHLRPRRHRLPAPDDRQQRAPQFQMWREITGTAMAA